MRLISQNGKINIPYEGMAVKATGDCGKYKIIAYDTSDNGVNGFCVMATYDSYEKMMKAMEMLRYTPIYDFVSDGMTHKIPVFEFPKNEDVT